MKTKQILKFVIAYCLLHSAFWVNGQNEFYYAKELVRYNDSCSADSNIQKQKSLFNLSQKLLDNEIKYSDIIKQLDEFIQKNKDIAKANESKANETTPKAVVPISKNIINPSISESDIIYAIADVMIDRAKEEISIAFFDKMLEKFESDIVFKYNCGNINVKLKNLFPNTYLIIKNIKDNYNLQLGNTFKTALEQDINNLYTNISAYAIPECLYKNPDFVFIKALIKIYNELKNQNHPLYILQNIKPAINNNSSIAECVISAASIISTSLINPETETWYDKSELLLSKEYFDIYLALLLKNPENELCFDKIGITKFSYVTNKQNVSGKIKAIINQIYLIKEKIQYINNAISSDNDYGYANTSSDQDNKKAKKAANYDTHIFEDIISIFENIYDLYAINSDSKEIEKIKTIKIALNLTNYNNAIKQKDYGKVAISVLQILEPYMNEEKLPKDFVKYLIMLSDISQAKTSEDAKKVLESAMLPVGSWSIKRENKINISVNGYLGGFFGWEDMYKIKDNSIKKSFGVSAPIGLSFSKGDLKCNDKRGGKSLSLFVSIVDLGNLVSYRLNADSVSTSPNIQFKNILSPGAFVVYNFGKCPLSIGGGVQIGPQLRDVSATNVNIDKNYYLRYSFFVAIDIPFFNLYTKPRN